MLINSDFIGFIFIKNEEKFKLLSEIFPPLFNIILQKKQFKNLVIFMLRAAVAPPNSIKIVTRRPGLSIHSLIYTWATLKEYGHTTYVYSITPWSM